MTERWPVKWLEEEVGKHGVSVWRERQLVSLVFGVGGVSSLSQPTQRALMRVFEHSTGVQKLKVRFALRDGGTNVQKRVSIVDSYLLRRQLVITNNI